MSRFSHRAEEIAHRAILRADVHGMAHYGPAPAPLDETRDKIQEAIEELLDAIYYHTREIARLEDLREMIAAVPRRCSSSAGRNTAGESLRNVSATLGARRPSLGPAQPLSAAKPHPAPEKRRINNRRSNARLGATLKRCGGGRESNPGPLRRGDGETVLDATISPRAPDNNGCSEETAAGGVMST